MKKKPYLPKREPDRVVWLNTFASKIGGLAASLGITPAEVIVIMAMAKFYEYIINLISISKAYTQDLTKFKNTLSFAPNGTTLGPLPVLTPPPALPLTQAGIFTYMSAIIARIKASANYTEGIGEELKIIGNESDFDAANFKPDLKGKAMPNMVNLTFAKDQTDGMNIYARLQGQTTWVFLALDTESPYMDTRPLAAPGTPENREYRCRGVISDLEIGQWSDVVQVTFAG